tara:strand:- start:61526 stop:62845 length:1320 start_codon:yes stop_codon:yes gene_type:complete
MSLETSKLARALASAIAVDEFIVSEVRSREATESFYDVGGRSERVHHEREAQLFVDRKRGRGMAILQATLDAPLAPQIREASTRAFEALGPTWRLPQPKAPARVRVHESNDGSPRDVARAALAEFRRALPETLQVLTAKLRVLQCRHRTVLSTGFDNQYPSTDIWLDAIVQTKGGVPVPLTLRARRLANLDIAMQDAMQRVARQSAQDATAAPTQAGLVDLVLLHSAYLPQAPGDFGIWTPMVAQAQASRVRAGISTHNRGQPLFHRTSSSAGPSDTLHVRSEGTKSFALQSAPFSADGQAVRNFSLVENGLATGVAVDHRDSALGAGTANGGVRRLVVGGGSQSAEQIGRPESRPVLFVQSLRSVETNPNGQVFLDVASAEMRTRDALGRIVHAPVRSAVVSGNLRAWLETLRMSKEMADDSWLNGPRLIRINNVRTH